MTIQPVQGGHAADEASRSSLVLMADDKREPTQTTQPKGIDPTTDKPFEPVEIPVPKRSTFDKLLGRAEKAKRPAKG
jgi:hypothetical protein